MGPFSLPGMESIDVRHMGREKVTCCWRVGDVIVDPGPQESAERVIEALGEAPRAILLTHIHLDHAGGTGSLLERWPDVPVYVHELGAPHLIDPSRLEASAGRLWDDMEERWGHTRPVPEASVNLVGEGDTVHGFRVAYTPGHASHHVAYLHEASGWAFVGDVMGVRVAPEAHTIMPTPPPDIDVDAWLDSIAIVEGWDPQGIGVTHFGGHEDVAHVLADARSELERWAARAREVADEDAYTAEVERDIDEQIADDELRDAIRQATTPRLQYSGLERYWRKLGNDRHP
jgi:glyoxylase-like metal-dependent hydrolase (beta-lactamase superfamily II)